MKQDRIERSSPGRRMKDGTCRQLKDGNEGRKSGKKEMKDEVKKEMEKEKE
jgi:hypothetical protein